MGKGRFTYCQSHAIDCSFDCRIDLALHFIGKPLLASCILAGKVGDLSALCPLRITKTLPSKFYTGHNTVWVL